jgi:hypothetical protein
MGGVNAGLAKFFGALDPDLIQTPAASLSADAEGA